VRGSRAKSAIGEGWVIRGGMGKKRATRISNERIVLARSCGITHACERVCRLGRVYIFEMFAVEIRGKLVYVRFALWPEEVEEVKVYMKTRLDGYSEYFCP
jgi:hypothetical protein